MMQDTIDKLRLEFSEAPILCAETLPTADEVENASRTIGVPFASDYREFLLMFGSAMVGPHPIYGLRPTHVMRKVWSVVEVTQRYRREWTEHANGWVVISNDHAGNPVGMDAEGAIWIFDHDFGGLAKLAKNFEEYLRVRCLKLPS